MQKQVLSTIAIATILASLFIISSVQPAKAYVYSDVSDGSIGNPVIGKYGCMVSYEATGGSDDSVVFYPSMEVKSVGYPWFISTMQIEVSGTKPNGQPISGNQLTPVSHIISPSGGSEDWDNALETIFNIIQWIDPSGLSDIVTMGQGISGGFTQGFTITDSNDADSAYTHYTMNYGWAEKYQRGYQFKATLQCDPSLGGTYTLNIHYSVTLAVDSYGYYTQDIYQTVTYEFTPPYASSDVWWGTLCGYGQTFTGWNIIGYAADENYVYLQTWQQGDGTGIIAQMNTGRPSGHTDVWVYGMDTGTPSHIYVYVSLYDNYDWQFVGDFISDGTVPKSYHAGYTSAPFNYIAIASYHDEGYEPTIFLVDCVTTT